MTNDLASRVGLHVRHRLHRNHRRLLKTRFLLVGFEIFVSANIMLLDYLSLLASVWRFLCLHYLCGRKTIAFSENTFEDGC